WPKTATARTRWLWNPNRKGAATADQNVTGKFHWSRIPAHADSRPNRAVFRVAFWYSPELQRKVPRHGGDGDCGEPEAWSRTPAPRFSTVFLRNEPPLEKC